MIATIGNTIRIIGYSLWIDIAAIFAAEVLVLEPQFLMPGVLEENSGLVWDEEHKTFWTHNDSGGKPRLFEVDSTGKIVKEVLISNAKNVDWEELALDRSTNTLFIGDFGNNRNRRKDLSIYYLPLPRIEGSSTTAKKISFTYPDQKNFPPDYANKTFDMEAMIFWNDSLYLFSKNRTDPYSGYTKMYRLPAVEGNYEAELVDSFATGGSYFMAQWITAADISPDGSKVVLLNNDHLWLFENFKAPYFLRGDATQYSFKKATQKEAITFGPENLLYISEEKSSGPGALYEGILP